MAQAQIRIQRTPSNTWWYTFEIVTAGDDVPNIDVASGFQNLNAALDAVKPRIAALPGAVQRLTFDVISR